MIQQKRVALINDLTGFGRCSIAVELPLVSAMKVQACPLPTAILSVHTGFPDHFLDDYTARMMPYIDSWKKNGLCFDGISTGFLGSEDQIEIVLSFVRCFKAAGTCVLVDPVMGDAGKMYASYTDVMCRKMKHLLKVADIVTPNLTEACLLLDEAYPEGKAVSEERLIDMAKKLEAEGPRAVVITGLNCGESVGNFIYEGGTCEMVLAPRIGGERSGSGDAFAAVVMAASVQGMPLTDAVRLAADFITKCIRYAEALELPWNYGLPFEEYLGELAKS